MPIIVHGTAQELFNKSVAHLLTQKAKSKVAPGDASRGKNCLYLSPDGKKCAIGGLLEDDDCRKLDEFGNSAIINLRVIHEIEFPELATPAAGEPDLLEDLQSCHDEYSVNEWPIRLAEIAGKYGLTFTPSEPVVASE